MSPSAEDYQSELESFMSGTYDTPMSEENRADFVSGMVGRGLTQQEAEKEFEGQLEISDYLHSHKQNASIVSSNCMFISYGYRK